jgi:hypothetical protein
MTAISGSGKYVQTEWMININIYWMSQTALKTASANTRFFTLRSLYVYGRGDTGFTFAKRPSKGKHGETFKNEYHKCYKRCSVFYIHRCGQSCRMHVEQCNITVYTTVFLKMNPSVRNM